MIAAIFLGALSAGSGIASPGQPDTPRPLRILCLGDSLTEGYGIPREKAWPALVQEALHKEGFAGAEVLNAGVNGSTSASGAQRIRWHLKSKDKPDILILELGANDGLRGVDTESTRANLKATIELAHAGGLKVLLAGMQMPPNYGAEYTRKFAAIFPDLAAQEKVALIPFFLEGVAGEKSLNLADGIHPNEQGNAIIADTVLKYLRPLLKS